jgi:hypothetical protein
LDPSFVTIDQTNVLLNIPSTATAGKYSTQIIGKLGTSSCYQNDVTLTGYNAPAFFSSPVDQAVRKG